jgi:glycosyltransferase involved in cell wall biosynthesis
MASAYTNGLKLKGVIMPGLPPHLYYSNYKYADVCVIPLVDSPFNSMKSNLKVLEAAHSGLPVIASAVHPYLDVPVLQVKKQGDWYKWLNDVDAQQENAKVLSEFVKINYDYNTINENRRKVFYE